MTFNDFKKMLQGDALLRNVDSLGYVFMPDRIIKKTHVIDRRLFMFYDDKDDPRNGGSNKLAVTLDIPIGYNAYRRAFRWEPVVTISYWNSRDDSQHLTITQFKSGISHMSMAHGKDNMEDNINDEHAYKLLKEFYDAYRSEE